eukprot:TRINITY_DN16452_c0_g1_i1.p1 TRINITY_DN16452_c0_g1~~TRINITY_DN16452_c0_g1_i1.p1  ORF type:complete len:483 (+),score=49.92 TRINITY_DN16452_c0_g1_i1:151-1599(+)
MQMLQLCAAAAALAGITVNGRTSTVHVRRKPAPTNVTLSMDVRGWELNAPQPVGRATLILTSNGKFGSADDKVDSFVAANALWRVDKDPASAEDRSAVGFHEWRLRPVAPAVREVWEHVMVGQRNCGKRGAKPQLVPSHGFAVDTGTAIFGMQYAGCTGQAAYVIPGGNEYSYHWHYSVGYQKAGRLGRGIRARGVRTGELNTHVEPVCPEKDFSCYFLPATRCKRCRGCSQLRLKDLQVCTPAWDEMQARTPMLLGYFGLRTYFMRPKGWLRRVVLRRYANFVRQQGGQLGVGRYGFGNGHCAAIHVRRSDISLGQRGTKLMYAPVTSFVDKLRTIADPMPRDILLMTDDAGAVEEAKAIAEFRWVTMDRKRFRGSSGGWENHFPSGDPKEEVITILTLLRLVSRCRAGFIASGTSGFSKLLYQHQCLWKGEWSCTPHANVTSQCDNCTTADRENVRAASHRSSHHTDKSQRRPFFNEQMP